MAVVLEQAFMDSLLDGLDASVFDVPSQSQSQPSLTPTAGPTTAATAKMFSQNSQASQPRAPLSQKSANIASHDQNKAIFAKPPVKPRAVAKPVKPSTPRASQKQRASQPATDEFDLLLDDVNWSDDMDLDTQYISQPVLPFSRQYLRCIIESVTEQMDPASKKFSKILQLSPDEPTTSANASRTVFLQDDWLVTEVEEGDTINLLGPVPSASNGSKPLHLNRNNNDNMIILLPDTLITATAISSATVCSRKAVLQDRLRSSQAVTEPLLYGNLQHELFQTCLQKSRWDFEFRQAEVQKLCLGEDSLAGAWEIGKTVEDVAKAILERSERWSDWADRFIGDEPEPDAALTDPRRGGAEDQGTVCLSNVHDIEEDIWSPKYGLKGKIDVSIQMKVEGSAASAQEQSSAGVVAPFEIKTGKTNGIMDHRAQTMLYTLMMSDRYDHEILSGLLYYSQTDQVIRVAQAKNELRGLIQTRNELARYMSQRSRSSSQTKKDQGDLSLTELVAEDGDQSRQEELGDGEMLLPAPLDQARVCKRCYASDACMLYRKALNPIQEGDVAEELQEVYNSKVGHLSDEQSRFFKQWDELISHEEREMDRFKKEIWTMTANQRQEVGRCIADMLIDSSYQHQNNSSARAHQYTYKMVRANSVTTTRHAHDNSASLLGGHISVGDPVIISSTEPDILAIARGFVLELRSYHIVVGLDHSLVDLACTAVRKSSNGSSKHIFRIDKDELIAGMSRIRDNLAQLFYSAGDIKRLSLVVDLAPPSFSTLPSSFAAEDEPSLNLNPDQLEAINKVFSAQDYALILGMPGTGKTTTIAEVIAALTRRGKSVLLTSYTHSAVDNILLKLVDKDLDILRLGNREKVMPILHQYTLANEGAYTETAELEERLMKSQVVATTALSVNHALFRKRHFDYCIVDEASQITLPTCLGPLRYADVFVLVGDHNQLPPLVKNSQARQGGLDISLFRRLSEAHPEALVYLTYQYRMNEEIMSLSNGMVYDGRMKCGTEDVKKRRLVLPNFDAGMNRIHKSGSCVSSTCWVQEVIREDRSVVFVDTDSLPARESRSGRLVYNETEADLVHQVVNGLEKCGLPQNEIGVIALYRQQIKHLASFLDRKSGIEVLTADRSQGRDKECIVMSLTRSNEEGHCGELLKDWRRLNVCLTRAKSKLIIFGSRSTLSNLTIFANLCKDMEAKGWIYKMPAGSDKVHTAISLASSPVKRTQRSSQAVRSKKKIKIGLSQTLVEERPILREIINSSQ